MQTDEILQFLSDNHQALILVGGLISFISVFLPFYKFDEIYMNHLSLQGFDISLSTTWLFWIYLIAIGALYYGYFQGLGEKYPQLFLAIGGLLVLMTLYGTQLYSGIGTGMNLMYGFFLEFIGSASVAVGGYYYNELHKAAPPS